MRTNAAEFLRSRERVLFGLPMHAMTMEEVVGLCDDALRSRARMLIGVVNAAKIVKMRRDPELRASLLECDVVVADGQSVVWASRLLRKRLPERVAGIDLFERLLASADRNGRSVYLLGAKPEVVTALRQRIVAEYPRLRVAGARDGYYTESEAPQVAADIRGSAPDMLFLGMVTPKKEIFLREWADTLGVPVLHGVGGSFDVLAGVTRRAPLAWQRYGLEWLYRLLQEPRRLGPRYFTTNVAFIRMTVVEMVRPTARYAHPLASAPESDGSSADPRRSFASSPAENVSDPAQVQSRPA